MAPLQRIELWSTLPNLFDEVYSETDEGFVDLQVTTIPLHDDHYDAHADTTKHTTTSAARSTTSKKTVSFAMSHDVCIIDNKTCLSAEEKAQIWYDKKDYHRFKDSCRRIIEWISHRHYHYGSFFAHQDVDDDNTNNNNNEEETKYCIRGLERHTREGTDKYIQRNNSMANDLMILRMTGATQDEIATIMVQHSLPCVAEAQERARQDALAAYRYQHESSHLPTTPTTAKTTNWKQPLAPATWINLLPTIRPIRDQCTTT